ncbi:GAF domain-containing sensor histidine kinase [Algicella marina]|uniref:histidine kinase n=1 Tax=Algicella marina TaxID=2683284 RepID=A0A6P1T392_9RHOB|nr:GAF domain-containing sensor histidine kinase [Algicella marina]QHQ37198.1 GAF domain-containing protein [Algicella marina]
MEGAVDTGAADFQDDIDAIGRSTQVPTLLDTVLLATGMGFAAVARVTESRWITCRTADYISFGLEPGSELDVETTLCNEVRESSQEIVINDVMNDEIYCNHHTPAQYGFRSYISVPITLEDGRFFGTLCAIDPEPRNLKDERVLSMFRLFARLIGEGLDADVKLRKSEQAVARERHLSEVQERFIAILAHDLRSPVNVISSGLRMLERFGVDGQAKQVVTLLKGSVGRMSNLIEDLLTQARERQGTAIIVRPELNDELPPILHTLVEELNAVLPDREIAADISLPEMIRCDSARLAQLVSNLLANAVTHGTSGDAIDFKATVEDGTLVVAVANGGDPIPPEQQANLFLPFEQGGERSSKEGLGLGLYIAAEIAKGHGGTLEVGHADGRTIFTFTMPDAV